jgi:hypothetical protein
MFSASIFRGSTNQHAIPNRRTSAKEKEISGNLGAQGKSFRAKRLYDVDAGGACRREHRSDYRRA